MTQTLKDIATQAEQIVRSQKYFNADKELKRYDITEIEDYIAFCCEQSFYIEAYSLTLQYIDELIRCLFEYKKDRIQDTSIPIIIKTFYSLKLIDEASYADYIKVKDLRNKLMHELIRTHNVKKAIISKKADIHKTDLLKLIAEFEENFIKLAKKHNFLIFENYNNHKSDIFIGVLAKKAFKITSDKGIKLINNEAVFKQNVVSEIKKMYFDIKSGNS